MKQVWAAFLMCFLRVLSLEFLPKIASNTGIQYQLDVIFCPRSGHFRTQQGIYRTISWHPILKTSNFRLGNCTLLENLLTEGQCRFCAASMNTFPLFQTKSPDNLGWLIIRWTLFYSLILANLRECENIVKNSRRLALFADWNPCKILTGNYCWEGIKFLRNHELPGYTKVS